MTLQPYQEDNQVPANPLNSAPAKRIRWATQRAAGANGAAKRENIFRRLSHRRSKRDSAGIDLESTPEEGASQRPDEIEHEGPGRRIFFNVPLPPDARDEEGHPNTHYPRNKIRTAKYTPLSFVPKNLWFQFQNVANVYFFFIIILGVRLAPVSCSSPADECE